MVGDAEQDNLIINCVKENPLDRPSRLDATSDCRKDRLAKDELLLEQSAWPSAGYGDEDDLPSEDMDQGSCDGYVANNDQFNHSLTDDPQDNKSSSEETTVAPDALIHEGREQDFKNVGAISELFREIFGIRGFESWEELGRAESTYAPSFDCDISQSNDHTLIIMDEEALDQGLLTKSFLNDL
ncbi:uncharacterized protein LOC110984588 [Acanthaster planci]|uniref:Uncharacterized protein LOC110984588 n=1 Tax=Acanthaster planci TaxID=133434 RepID=A0A8B7Z740_ACAPL|nr:uncharacterized protein LOC110984588 [Acanthaster planci]